jgi:hypothetical protein
MAYNDELYGTLRGLGDSGTLSAMLYRYYGDNGGTGNSFPEREYNWLGARGYLQPTLNGRWYAYFTSLGYSGSIDHMKYLAVKGGTLLYSVLSLFKASEQGVWYDPSDLSTLYQDAAGTIRVTGVEQPVGRMLDKSGRGNHATQPTAINRPVLRQDGNGRYYLAFNGTDAWMQTGSINFTATNKMTVVAGVRIMANSRGILVHNTSSLPTPGTAGQFALEAPGFNTSKYIATTPAVTGNYDASSAAFTAPHSAVLLSFYDLAAVDAANAVIMRTNRTNEPGFGAGAPLGGVFPNTLLNIGSANGGGNFFNGNLYILIVRGALTSAGEINSVESYVNSRTGAY